MSLYKGLTALEKHFVFDTKRLAKELGIAASTIYSIYHNSRESSSKVERAIEKRYPEVNMDFIKYQIGDLLRCDLEFHKMGNDSYGIKVPGISDDQVREDVPIYGVHDKTFTMPNDSMAPCIQSGDHIIAKKIPSKVDVSKNIYVIKTQEMGILVRRIKLLMKEGVFLLSADNDEYDNLRFPIDSIEEVYAIRTITRDL